MRLYRAARAEHGLSAAASTPVIKEVCVAATDEEALEVARPYLKDKYDAYVDWGQSDVLPPADTLRREFAELTAGGRFVLGSPETCAAILADHVDRLGVDQFVCRLQWPGMPQQQVLNSMRLLAREVWPAFTTAAPGTAATDCCSPRAGDQKCRAAPDSPASHNSSLTIRSLRRIAPAVVLGQKGR